MQQPANGEIMVKGKTPILTDFKDLGKMMFQTREGTDEDTKMTSYSAATKLKNPEEMARAVFMILKESRDRHANLTEVMEQFATQWSIAFEQLDTLVRKVEAIGTLVAQVNTATASYPDKVTKAFDAIMERVAAMEKAIDLSTRAGALRDADLQKRINAISDDIEDLGDSLQGEELETREVEMIPIESRKRARYTHWIVEWMQQDPARVYSYLDFADRVRARLVEEGMEPQYLPKDNAVQTAMSHLAIRGKITRLSTNLYKVKGKEDVSNS